jgi:hypothetical protein
MVDRTSAPDYKPPLPAPVRTGSAQVAQLVEHATENRSVGGSIPPLGTIAPSPCLKRDGAAFKSLLLYTCDPLVLQMKLSCNVFE